MLCYHDLMFAVTAEGARKGFRLGFRWMEEFIWLWGVMRGKGYCIV